MNRRLKPTSQMHIMAAIGCMAVIVVAQARSPKAGRVFIGCPVYRNTNDGPKSGCWLVIDNSDGIRYDISLARMKPQIGHEVLVEGELKNPNQNITGSASHTSCGGVVLSPVIVSPLARACPVFMLPAEGYPGRKFILNLKDVLPPTFVPEKLPKPPFVTRTWHIQFTFDSDFLQYQYSEVILDQIARYVRAGHPKSIEITGYALTQPRRISGRVIAERPKLASERADIVALALRRLRVSPAIMKVRWKNNPPPLTRLEGLSSASRRRVDIKLTY